TGAAGRGAADFLEATLDPRFDDGPAERIRGDAGDVRRRRAEAGRRPGVATRRRDGRPPPHGRGGGGWGEFAWGMGAVGWGGVGVGGVGVWGGWGVGGVGGWGVWGVGWLGGCKTTPPNHHPPNHLTT